MRLRNVSKQRVDVTLDHGIYCVAAGACECRKIGQARIDEHSSGFARARVSTMLVPREITILARSVFEEELHEAVKKCPSVASRLGSVLREEA